MVDQDWTGLCWSSSERMRLTSMGCMTTVLSWIDRSTLWLVFCCPCRLECLNRLGGRHPWNSCELGCADLPLQCSQWSWIRSQWGVPSRFWQLLRWWARDCLFIFVWGRLGGILVHPSAGSVHTNTNHTSRLPWCDRWPKRLATARSPFVDWWKCGCA